jgi:hypothetical protein
MGGSRVSNIAITLFLMLCVVKTVADWKGKIEELVAGYEPRNVYNGDETGLFFTVLPSKTLTVRGDKCTGGKLSKEILDVIYLC